MLGACQNDRPGRQKGARVGQPPGRIDQLSGRAVRVRNISTGVFGKPSSGTGRIYQLDAGNITAQQYQARDASLAGSLD
jgi:hypothetical protein